MEYMDERTFANLLDNTLLQPDARPEQIREFCLTSLELGAASVFAHSAWLPISTSILAGREIKIGCSIGYPLGAIASEIKAMETSMCLELGATEVDMQMNLGAFLSGDHDFVKQDILAVKQAIQNYYNGPDRPLLKVILETCYLSPEQIHEASILVADTGADYVKTSSGFAEGGATIEAVKIMVNAVGHRCKVKASGGIRDLDTALAMIQAGASRLGTSRGSDLILEFRDRFK
jgi:deoxyribose-phosphate aldolase